MAVIAVCVALVLGGVVLVVRWGGDAQPGGRSFARHVAVAIAAGLVAGVLAAGAGGRLVMRLLALTSPEVEGSFTEAGELVGEITIGGTLGFMLFTGLPAGLISGALYTLVRPLLPRGRLGGVAFGALLWVLLATRVEPLRSENVDFALVGPAWLAVLGFSVVALLHGMVLVALATRWGSPPGAASVAKRTLTVGWIALGVVVLAALPSSIAAVADILSAG